MEENEILVILATFEKELGERLQESKGEIERVKYYEKFNINGIEKIHFNGVFITTEKDVDGNISYHMYLRDASNEILSIDYQGNLKIKPELESFLGDLNIEELMLENEEEKGQRIGISQKTNPKEMEEEIKTEPQQKMESEQQVEQDLKDLGIVNYKKIKDNNLDRDLKNVFQSSSEKGSAYSRTLGAFVLVEKVDGKFQVVQGVEPTVPTRRSVVSISENGERVERKVPHALMKTSDSKKELSITIGQYGYVEVGVVNVLPCNERVEMQLREQGEGLGSERTKQIRDLQNLGGVEAIHDLIHRYNEEEYEKDKEINNLEDLEDQERIYTEEEEEIIAEEAKKEEMSVEDYKKELEQIPEEYTLEEKIRIVHENKEKERQELSID